MINLQKANFGKRIVAAILDGILVSILAAGILVMFSTALNTDRYIETTKAALEKYETEYGVNLSAEEYNNLNEEQQKDYAQKIELAEKTFAEDQDAVYAYTMWFNLTLIGITLSVFLGVLIIEFIVPLFFGNGQTLGKKIFGIAIMHKDGIRINNIQLFIRTVLGKFAVELMIPIYIAIMIFFNTIGISGPIIILILLVIQFICLAATHTNSLLHDVMSGVIVVDMASQKIFNNREDLIEYTKKIHAEKADKPTF